MSVKKSFRYIFSSNENDPFFEIFYFSEACPGATSGPNVLEYRRALRPWWDLSSKKNHLILAFLERKCQIVCGTSSRAYGVHLPIFQKFITLVGVMQIWTFFRLSSSFGGGQIIHIKLPFHHFPIIENPTPKKTNVRALGLIKSNYVLPPAFGPLRGPKAGGKT